MVGMYASRGLGLGLNGISGRLEEHEKLERQARQIALEMIRGRVECALIRPGTSR
jgi:hypothetical protein